MWHVWLLIGVILTAAYLVWSLAHLIAFLCVGTPHSEPGNWYHCLVCLRFTFQTGFLVIGYLWTIAGYNLRFGADGELAASTLLSSTGTFMYFYVIIMIFLLMFNCAMYFCGIAWLCEYNDLCPFPFSDADD